MVTEVTWGTSWDTMMGGSQMILDSQAHSTIPNLVAFSDHAPYTKWPVDRGLRLTTIVLCHPYLQEVRATQSSRVKGLPVSEGRVERGLSAKDQRFNSTLPINVITNSTLFNSSSTLFHNELAV